MSEGAKPNFLKITGYVIWFALLVRLLQIGTRNKSSNLPETAGFYLGLALILLVPFAILYFIARYRAKRRNGEISWIFVMVGMTIITLLFAFGGLYGRLNTQITSPTLIQPSNGASKTMAHESLNRPTPQSSLNQIDHSSAEFIPLAECYKNYPDPTPLPSAKELLGYACEAINNPSTKEQGKQVALCILTGARFASSEDALNSGINYCTSLASQFRQNIPSLSKQSGEERNSSSRAIQSGKPYRPQYARTVPHYKETAQASNSPREDQETIIHNKPKNEELGNLPSWDEMKKKNTTEQ